MWEDSFLINFGIFAAGQVTAYLYLRTGRRSRGLALMMGGWFLVDFALLRRFAFQEVDTLYFWALLSMQAWSGFEVGSYLVARIRRRRPKFLALREEWFRTGFDHYLRNELDEAAIAYRRILRGDPWDVSTTLALATTLARAGGVRRARSLLRTARSLDVGGEYRHAIGDELRRFSSARTG
jgi:hypothetical protein